jgi:bilirubin oxidase
MSIHVHGQYNRAPFDGWAADYAAPRQYKDYYYPNAQNARTIWYHVSILSLSRHLYSMRYGL